MEQASREVGSADTDDGGRQKEGAVRRRRLGECAEKEDGGDDRAWKRRRLLGGEGRLVLREGGLVREVLRDRDFYEDASFTEEVGGSDDDVSLVCDSSDVDVTDEEADHERSDSSDSDGWGVAFHYGTELWTEAQWHCYWQQQGWFIDNNSPFPLPFIGGRFSR